jgi:hypothetical protein
MRQVEESIFYVGGIKIWNYNIKYDIFGAKIVIYTKIDFLWPESSASDIKSEKS